MGKIAVSSLRTRLILLIFLVFVPIILSTAFHAWEERRRQEAHVTAQAEVIFNFAAINEQKNILEIEEILAGLAKVPGVAIGGRRCSSYLSNLLKNYPRYLNFGVARPDGEVVCSAVSYTKVPNIADRLYFRSTLENGSFSIGQYQVGRITGKPSINFGYPVLDRNGKVFGVIFTAMDLSSVAEFEFNVTAQLPEGSTYVKLDSNGSVLSSFPASKIFEMGKALEKSFFEKIAKEKKGTFTATGTDGVERMYLFSTVWGSLYAGESYLLIAIPVKALFAESERFEARNLMVLGMVTMLAILVVWIAGGHLIVRPLSVLADVSKRLAAGDFTARAALPMTQEEIGQLGRAFDEMAAELERGQEVSRRMLAVAAEKQELGNRLLSLINNVPGMVYRGHRDWSLSFIGAKVESVTGYTADELLSGAVNWKEIIHPDDLAHVKESYRKAVQERSKLLRLEYRIRHKNGDIRWVADRRQMIYGETGSFDYVDGLLIDITERKDFDRRLVESEYRFRTITNLAANGIVTADTDGNIEFFNRAAERLFGYASEEVIGKHVTMLIPERFRSAHKAGWERFLKTGETRIIGRTVELEALRKDGTEFPIELSLGTWGPREAPLFSAILTDITERKKAEKMKDLKAHITTIFLTVSDEDIFNEVLKVVLDVMRSPYGVFGYLEEDGTHVVQTMTRQEWDKRQVPDQSIRFPRETWGDGSWPRAYREKKADYSNEPSGKTPEGHVPMHRYISLPIVHQGKAIGLFQVANKKTDYTEEDVRTLETIAGEIAPILKARLQRDRAKNESNRLTAAIEQADEAIIITDPGGAIQYVNPSFVRITGYSRDEAIGQNPRILKSGKQDETFYKKLWGMITSGETFKGTMINRAKDGSFFEEEATISPVFGSSGKIINFVAVKREMTRERELQRQVQTAQRMEAVGTLAGGIAHDFNNALTGVFGFGEILRSQLAGNKDALSNLDQILRSGERAATLTRQLLTYSRRQIIDPINLSLNTVVTDLLKLVSKVVGEHIEIRTFLEKGLPIIRADVGQIEQVLMNLVLNARDAMPSGGRLTIETGLTNLDDDYVRYHPYMRAGWHVHLTVSDTGIGMDQKTRERVFEPFFTTKAHEKGSGLGLAVVYGIVKQHNGFIHLYSEPGKGTTFKIYFLPAEGAPDVIETAKPFEIRGGTETVLLAEDDESVRMLAERTLRELGYTVLSARNGEDAVEIFGENREKVSLALLDVFMPAKGGKEAYEEMHKLKPELKVIFMSGYAADAVHVSFVLIPKVSFLAKPFGSQALAIKVREVLDREE